MTAINTSTPPIAAQTSVRTPTAATDADGDNDGSAAPAAAVAARGPAALTDLSSAAQAILSGK